MEVVTNTINNRIINLKNMEKETPNLCNKCGKHMIIDGGCIWCEKIEYDAHDIHEELLKARQENI